MKTTPNISRRSFLGLQGLALMAALAGCSTADDEAQPEVVGVRSLDDIHASGYLNIGISSDNTPFGFINETGAYDGFDHYFALHLAEYLGVAPRFVCLDPPQRYDALLSGEVDVSLLQMSDVDERAGEAFLATGLYSLALGLVSRKEDAYSSLSQLDDVDLMVCNGTYAQQYVQAALPDKPLRSYDTLSDMYAAFEDTERSAVLADEMSLATWIRNKPNYMLSIRALGDPRIISPAVCADQPELAEQVDLAVASFVHRGRRKYAYTNDIRPFVGDSYAYMFDAVVIP